MLVASGIFNLHELKLRSKMDGNQRVRLRKANRRAIKYKLACFGGRIMAFDDDYSEAKKPSTVYAGYLVTGDRQL